ncbi:MAG: CvpA family protein [Gammaproteobacteria bacterium]|nr:MAG: CvpA family protein [Gammaproteobacteria bacterium]
MNWVDYTIIGIIVVSAIIGTVRGFVRETLSLIAWIAAFWVALTFSQEVSVYGKDYISDPAIREGVAFILLFLGTLIVLAIINALISRLIERTGVSGTDMMLGFVFGIVRGVAVVAILVLLAGLTSFPQEPWWKESTLMEHFVKLALWIRDFLPEDIAKHFQL